MLNESTEIAETLLGALTEEYAKTIALTGKVEKLKPKALYCDLVLQTENTVPVSLIAKDYGMTAASFNRLLHLLGIQYKVGGTWVLYSKYANKGYTKARTYYIADGSSVMHSYWTQKGRRFLYYFLADAGIFPLSESGRPAAI
jgi:phage antirepressor YoqD-like protein